MKGILKLFPVAMAVLALASCSDIDSLESKNGAAVAEDGDLVISFDPMEVDGEAVATRGMRTKTPSTLNFEEGDLVNVYDADLYKHDVYEYEPGSPKGKFNVIAPQRITTGSQYALYPAGAVKRGYWDRESDKSIAEFAIEPIITYDASSEAKIGEEMYYSYELPSAGKAEWNASANRVDVKNFRALTGILQLNLEDALYNANWIKISSGKKISGTFKVILDTNAWDAIKLEEGDDDLITDNAIYVDMRQVPSRVNCVYVPIIAGIDTNVDGLTVEVAMNDVDDPTTIAVGDWYDTGLKFPNKVIAANKIYRGTKKFDLTDMTPNRVTEMLAQYKNSESPIELNCLDFTTNVAGSAEGNTIVLPDELDQDVTINFDADAFTTYTRTGTNYYVILQGEEYDGTVTINVNGNLGDTDELPIRVNMPKGNVVIAGNYQTTTAMRLQAAKSVQIGDGKTVTAYKPSTFKVENIENLTIAYQATVTGDLITKANNTSVTINGTLNGDIDMSTAVKNGTKLTIHGFDGDTSVTPALPKVNASVTGDVTTMCDVEISLPLEGIAIASGKALTLNGYDNTLTLIQGYVDKFVAQVENTGSWEDNKINVKLNDPNEGLAAFKAIEANANSSTGKPTVIEFTESLWDGKAIDASFTDYCNKYTDYKYIDEEGTSQNPTNAIITASQLASSAYYNGGNGVKLFNDIDLAAKEWKKQGSTGLLGSFYGQDHKIKRLNLGKANGSLFKITSSNALVQDLKIEGVTCDAAATSVLGALIDDVNLSTTLKNIEVSGINITSTKGLENVGGLVGKVSGTTTLTLENVKATGTIDGYKNIGGFIGTIGDGTNTATVTIDAALAAAKSSADVTIAQTYNSNKKMDMSYAQIGGIAGSVTTGSLAIAAGVTAKAPTHAHSAQEYVSDVDGNTGNFFDFNIDTTVNPYVGFSGTPNKSTTAGASRKVTIGKGATMITLYEPVFGFANAKAVNAKGEVTAYNGTTEKVAYYFSKQD